MAGIFRRRQKSGGESHRVPVCEFAESQHREEGSGGFRCQAGLAEPPTQKYFKFVMAGKLVNLAAYFVQAYPHSDDRTNAGECVSHQRDERAIAEADQNRSSFLILQFDGVEQWAHLLGGQHRDLAFLDAVLWAAHGVSGI
jgi:hypothetical protein